LAPASVNLALIYQLRDAPLIAVATLAFTLFLHRLDGGAYDIGGALLAF
jgi:hypothetical protein